MSSKNPKRIVDAFAPVGTQPAGVDLHLGEFTAGTVLILQQLEHPIIEGAGGKKKAVEMTDMQTLQLVFVLSIPVEECFDLLTRGRQAFDRAVMQFAGTITLSVLPLLGVKVAEAFARAVSTVLPGAQSAGAEKKTASKV